MSGTNTSRSSSDTGTGSTADTCSFPTSPHHHIWNRIPMGGQNAVRNTALGVKMSRCLVVLRCIFDWCAVSHRRGELYKPGTYCWNEIGLQLEV